MPDLLTSFITIAGSICSVAGAGLSWIQAKRSKKSATKAERIRLQLIDHQEAQELYNIQASCKEAQNSMAKYGPAFSDMSLAGNNQQKDAQIVQKFIFTIKEHRSYFNGDTNNKADEFFDLVSKLIEKFANSSDTKGQIKYGRQIVIHLNSFSASIKDLLDDKRKAVH